jgi:hypothetical protein
MKGNEKKAYGKKQIIINNGLFYFVLYPIIQGCHINKKVDANDEANANIIKPIAFPVRLFSQ